MRAKAQKYDFNVKLMQILDIIEKKMNKETNLSRSRSHGSHDEKMREERSVGKYSFRKEHNISNTSPIRKHKIQTVVDEL
jgi:hypothetical protein